MSDLAELREPGAACEAIHPAIDHALRAFAPGHGIRAAKALRSVLGARLARGGDEAWKGSRLTGDGFPFELAFCTADDRLRFTVEPGVRDQPPHERLRLAAALAGGLGEAPVEPAVLEGLEAMQSHGSLAYGAWVGCRVGEGRTQCKLYVEVPQGAPLRSHGLALGDREATPRMLAYTPATGAFEAYCRVRSLEPCELAAVLAPAQAEARAPPLLDFIEECYGHPIRGRLPGPSVGVSYLLRAPERRVTLHFYARSMWGSDGGIRRGFSRAARGAGWDDEPYLRATAPIAQRDEWKTCHGLFGVTIDGSQRLALGIGVRPLPP